MEKLWALLKHLQAQSEEHLQTNGNIYNFWCDWNRWIKRHSRRNEFGGKNEYFIFRFKSQDMFSITA